MLLDYSATLNKVVDSFGPTFFVEKIGIENNRPTQMLVETLMAHCPSFASLDYLAKYESFVVSMNLNSLVPAISLPTIEQLQLKIQIKYRMTQQQQQLLSQQNKSFDDQVSKNKTPFPSGLNSELYSMDSAIKVLDKPSIDNKDDDWIDLGEENAKPFDLKAKKFKDVLLTHPQQRQEEILDNSIKNVEREINLVYSNYLNAQKTGASGDEKVYWNQFLEFLSQLSFLQIEQQKMKRTRFEEKEKYLKGNMDHEVITTQLSKINALKVVIQLLEKIYTYLLNASQFINYSKELCFIHEQLGVLYDLSVSIVFTGLISVGKSTTINCLIGFNIAPSRVQTMTAIPVRYVHDNNCPTPKMFVPFSTELNLVLDQIKLFLKEVGQPLLRESLARSSSRILIDKIFNGLTFVSQYTGLEEILEASTYIHDLYRLAIEEIFSNELILFLPLDWSRGINSFLTIYTRFRELSVPTGFVEFSLIDTPGIDEAGVQKLNLNQVIQDSMNTCNYCVLVFNSTNYNSVSLNPIKDLIYQAQQKWKIPCIALGTHSEALPNSEKEATKKNVSSSLLAHEKIIFTPDQIFLVSAFRKLICSRMIEFVDQNKRNPSHESKDENEKKLAEDWIFSLAFGDDEASKIEYYESLSQEKVKGRCEKVIEGSSMKEPIDLMVNNSVRNSIPLCTQASTRKTKMMLIEIINNLELELKELNTSTIETDLAELQKQKELVTFCQQKILKELQRKADEMKRALISQKDAIIRDMDLVILHRLADTDSLSTFMGYLNSHLKTYQNFKMTHILTQDDLLDCENAEETNKLIFTLKRVVRMSVKDFIETKSTNMAEELMEDALSKKSQIGDPFLLIGKILSSILKISFNQQALTHFRYLPESSQQDKDFEFIEKAQSPSTSDFLTSLRKEKEANPEQLQISFKEIISKILKRKKRLDEQTKTKINLNPKMVREDLKEYALEVIQETLMMIESQIEQVIQEIQEKFVINVNSEIGKYEDLIRKKMKVSNERLFFDDRRKLLASFQSSISDLKAHDSL